MNLKESMKSNIWKYNAFGFLDMFIIYVPYIIYYFQKLGFSLTSISVMNVVMAGVILVGEIPSGYFADRWGRKNSLILSVIFQIISMYLLIIGKDLTTLIISHIFIGLGFVFLSGANSALLYDTLIVLKKEKEYKRYEGKAKFYGEISVIIASLIGVFLIKFGTPNLILYSLIGHVLLLVLTFSFTEPPRHKLIEPLPLKKELTNIGDIIKRSIKNTKLLGLFIYSFIILGVSNTIYLIYQPYFRATNLSLPSFGIVFAVFSVVTGLVALKAHSIEKKLGVFKSLLIMPVFLTLSLLGAGAFFVWFGFAFFFLREFVRGFVFPVIWDYTNRIAKSSERATVLSIGGMFSRFGYIIIALIYGIFADIYSLKPVLIFMGVILVIITFIIPFMIKRKRKIDS